MRWSLFFFCIGIVQVYASNAYSQQTRLSLTLEKVKLEAALDQIENQSDYYFLYNQEFIDVDQIVSIVVENEDISVLMKQLLSSTNIEFTIRNRQIVLTPKEANGTSSQQVKSVSGTVTDAEGVPLPGVTVIVKGTTSGTVTDFDGNYTISDLPENAVLAFSFVGMKSKDVAVGNQPVINTSLEEETIGLEEVVAIGYGTKAKGELTGSISKAGNETFEARPVSSTLDALQGALPGVTVTRGSGRPGNENYGFQIRGYSSFSGNQPLVMIDGVPGDMGLINPNDIAEITVLKDAAASIYGARAADGVVLITTKKGKKGRLSVTYSGNYGVKIPNSLKKMANTLQMAEMYDEGMRNIGLPGVTQDVFDKIRANAEPDPNGGWMKYLENYPGFYQSTDWMDVIYGTAIQQTHNLSFAGGGDSHDFFFSAGYQKDEGIFNFGNNYSDRYNLRMNYTFRLFDRLKIETRTSFDNKGIVESAELEEALRVASRAWSYMPVRNPLGQYYRYQNYGNPAQLLDEGGVAETNHSEIRTNFKTELNILDDLKLVGQVGVNLAFGDTTATHPTVERYNWEGGIQSVGNVPNSADYSKIKNVYASYTTYLEYKKELARKHRFSLMAGASHEENDFEGQSITGYNFVGNDLFTLNLADRTKVEYADFTGSAYDWALTSFFGRFSYSLLDKYYLDFTTRVDGSSKFAPDKRWSAVFPAVSMSWNMSRENFIKSLGVFDNLKLRASWGKSGNQELSFGNYDYIPLISMTNEIYPLGVSNAGHTGAVSTIASEDRTWEVIETSNFGVDLAFLDSKLTGSFDYYVKRNDKMLVNQELPATLGGDAPTQNLGKLKTTGWDLTLGWNDNVGDFKYGISVIVSDSKNKLLELRGNDTNSEGLVFAREGYSLYSYFGYEYDGIIKDADQLAEYKTLGGNVPARLAIGDVMYSDVDGDGKITAFGDPALGSEGDLVYLGNMLPRYTYSSNINMSFKRFDLSVFLQGVGKREAMRTGDFAQPFYYVWHQPLEYFHGKNWTPENQDAQYPRIVPGGLGFDQLKDWNWRASSMRMNNLAYLRVKVLTVAYNLPQSLCNRLKMESMRVYLSGQDLFTIFKGSWNNSFDPEENWERTDEQTYPFSKVLSLGVDIKF